MSTRISLVYGGGGRKRNEGIVVGMSVGIEVMVDNKVAGGGSVTLGIVGMVGKGVVLDNDGNVAVGKFGTVGNCGIVGIAG
ncbi:hypothetical protein ACH5RR_012183 [Cinchona calisaya]|uniref:Uncharacterized protein n=1 Tax=Cinchona calisaya TaxID=153742 RepID=A0ABD3A9M6_9GENT